jgi:phosphatidylethanolamine-binding protein (PEBP) family uncharacterized protein
MLEKLPDAVGHALRDQRAGLDKLAFNLRAARRHGAIEVSSAAFADHAPIPRATRPMGRAVATSAMARRAPGRASLVLIVEDADAPTPRPLVHAIAVDLPPSRAHWPKAS